MSRESDGQAEPLSPISRRAFFREMGTKALKVGLVGTAVASLGQQTVTIEGCGGGRNCGYCDSQGSDYDHCDGDYCDYINYEDGGGYADSCGYCDSQGSDYDHCDGDYCDYINYEDAGSCGYCDGECREYEHCDGDYCDYINYSDGPNCPV